MLLGSCRLISIVSSFSVAVVCLALTACGGGYYTSKVDGGEQVYRVDEQGAKTLVYEIDQNGHTMIHDAKDPMAKRHAAAQEMAEQFRAKKAVQLEVLSAAPKRQSEDPIYVNLIPPVLDGKMQQAEKPKGAVAQQIRKEFASDPIIKLIDDNQQTAGPLKFGVAPPVADVDVSSKVSMKEVVGVNRTLASVARWSRSCSKPPSLRRFRLLHIPSPNPAMCCRTWKCPNVLPGESNRSLSKRSGRISQLIDPLPPFSAGRRNGSARSVLARPSSGLMV